MRAQNTRRTIACAAVLLITLTACGKSADEQANDCVKAIKSADKAGKPATKQQPPEACKSLSKDDYSTLLIDDAIHRTGMDKLPDVPDAQ